MTLTVTDYFGLTSTIAKQVLVAGGGKNQPPVASFTYVCANLVCDFDGTGSTDDVGVVSWLWTGPAGDTWATTPTFRRTFAAATTVNVTLKVTDGGGLSNSITKQVVVTGSGTNHPPVANFTSSCVTDVDGGVTCTFDGSSSTDDVGVVAWAWSSPGKLNKAGKIITYRFPGAGTYQVTLKVTDGGGLSNSLTRTITI